MYAHLVAVGAEDDALSGSTGSASIEALLRGTRAINIDKAWEAVFPLIGSIAETGMMLTDDPMPVGDDLGFGPALYISPDQVAFINARLIAADESTIEEHWDRLESPFMGPGDYDDDWGKRFALDGYRKTAELFRTAGDAGDAGDGVLFALL